MSDLDRTVAEVRAALAKATPGEWTHAENWFDGPLDEIAVGALTLAVVQRQKPEDTPPFGDGEDCANADLIANAPSWLSALCDGVEAMQRELAESIVAREEDVLKADKLRWAAEEEADKAEADRDAAYARGQAEENEACEKAAERFTAPAIGQGAYWTAQVVAAIRARRAPQAETEGRLGNEEKS